MTLAEFLAQCDRYGVDVGAFLERKIQRHNRPRARRGGPHHRPLQGAGVAAGGPRAAVGADVTDRATMIVTSPASSTNVPPASRPRRSGEV
jgi:hypothetical protein